MTDPKTDISIIAPAQGDIVDPDAIAMGELYERGGRSFISSIEALVECGRRLAEKKAAMAHGMWLPWLESNADVLGFESRGTAARLMKAATLSNVASTPHLNVRTAISISREIWKNTHVSANSGENEWYTPLDILDRARSVLGGFDLDPASSRVANEAVQAKTIFTADDDGLNQEWPVGTVWMNPPYAQPLIAQFCERFAAEMARGSTGIALVNNATETEWFSHLVSCAVAVCFLRGRVKYLNAQGEPENTPLQGQAIIYKGPDGAAFCNQFDDAGLIVRPFK